MRLPSRIPGTFYGEKADKGGRQTGKLISDRHMKPTTGKDSKGKRK
jgi:hypothetical protein